jgi:hypothetical protein
MAPEIFMLSPGTFLLFCTNGKWSTKHCAENNFLFSYFYPVWTFISFPPFPLLSSTLVLYCLFPRSSRYKSSLALVPRALLFDQTILFLSPYPNKRGKSWRFACSLGNAEGSVHFTLKLWKARWIITEHESTYSIYIQILYLYFS